MELLFATIFILWMLNGIKCIVLRTAKVTLGGRSGVQVDGNYAVAYGVGNILVGILVFFLVLNQNKDGVVVALLAYFAFIVILQVNYSSHSDKQEKAKR